MPNAQLKTITLPSGVQYDLVDQGARDLIAALEAYSDYLGVTTTALEDGSTTNPVTINDESVTAKKGNIVNYGAKEFIFNGTAWQEFGDLSALGELAYVDSVVASYTPAGTVSQPTITVTPTTTTVNSITAVGTLPSATMPTYTVTGTDLAISAGSFDAGTLPTKGNDVSVVSGATAALDAAPTFAGTAATITSTVAS